MSAPWRAAGPTASALLLQALHRHPDQQAFVWDGGALSYRASAELIGRLQAVLAADWRSGARLAVLSGNRAEAWCAEAALQALGGAVTWLHPMAGLEAQQAQLEDAQIDALLVDPQAFAERGAALAEGLGPRALVWTLGPAGFGRDLLAAAGAVGSATPRVLAGPHDPVTLNYTGGTTGRAKAALRRQHAHAAMWRAILADFELPATPRYLAAAPISHVAGTKIAPVLWRGGTVHLMRGFEPEAFLHTVQRERINMSLLVPTMIYTLLDAPGCSRTDLSSLELLLYGASPMSPSRLQEAIERIGPVWSQLYGQTECYPISVLRKRDHDPRQPALFGSCGAPVAAAELRLLDEAGQDVAPGEPGEICVRAAHMMEAYWQREALTRETVVDGWLHTGDIARRDERGYLFIVDRKKDMIVSGGFNVYPREVEDVLSSDPAVAMAAVIGVPDPKWGEAVLAYVVPRPGQRIDTDQLAQRVRARQGAPHTPKHFEICSSLPLTALGKIDKKALRAAHWGAAGRQVA